MDEVGLMEGARFHYEVGGWRALAMAVREELRLRHREVCVDCIYWSDDTTLSGSVAWNNPSTGRREWWVLNVDVGDARLLAPKTAVVTLANALHDKWDRFLLNRAEAEHRLTPPRSPHA